jgi:hypothetical protein
MQHRESVKETKMAYEIMYEGDGFIRRGPEPKAAGIEQGVLETRKLAKAKAKAKSGSGARRGGGITMFRFTRMVFGR